MYKKVKIYGAAQYLSHVASDPSRMYSVMIPTTDWSCADSRITP